MISTYTLVDVEYGAEYPDVTKELIMNMTGLTFNQVNTAITTERTMINKWKIVRADVPRNKIFNSFDLAYREAFIKDWENVRKVFRRVKWIKN